MPRGERKEGGGLRPVADHEALASLHIEVEILRPRVVPLPLIDPELLERGARVAHDAQDIVHIGLGRRPVRERLGELSRVPVLPHLLEQLLRVLILIAESGKHIRPLVPRAFELLAEAPALDARVVAV